MMTDDADIAKTPSIPCVRLEISLSEDGTELTVSNTDAFLELPDVFQTVLYNAIKMALQAAMEVLTTMKGLDEKRMGWNGRHVYDDAFAEGGVIINDD